MEELEEVVSNLKEQCASVRLPVILQRHMASSNCPVQACAFNDTPFT
jgi:hypothetical protein